MYPRGRCSHCKRKRVHRKRQWERCVRDKFDAVVFIAFFSSHLLAMHVAGRVKTSALLTGDI